MALPGELHGTDGTACSCGKKLQLQVLHSPAGHYLGYTCDDCGPWSRESSYFTSHEAAEIELDKIHKTGESEFLRDTGFHPSEFIVEEISSI